MKIDNSYFFTYDPKLLQDNRITTAMIKVLMAIQGLSSKYGWCHAGSKYISETVGCSVRTLHRNCQKLEEFGYLERVVEKDDKRGHVRFMKTSFLSRPITQIEVLKEAVKNHLIPRFEVDFYVQKWELEEDFFEEGGSDTRDTRGSDTRVTRYTKEIKKKIPKKNLSSSSVPSDASSDSKESDIPVENKKDAVQLDLTGKDSKPKNGSIATQTLGVATVAGKRITDQEVKQVLSIKEDYEIYRKKRLPNSIGLTFTKKDYAKIVEVLRNLDHNATRYSDAIYEMFQKDFHKEQNYRYLTPSFIGRQEKINQYIT